MSILSTKRPSRGARPAGKGLAQRFAQSARDAQHIAEQISKLATVGVDIPDGHRPLAATA